MPHHSRALLDEALDETLPASDSITLFLRWQRPLAAIHATAALGTTDAMTEWRMLDLEKHIYSDAFAPTRGRISMLQDLDLGFDPDPDVIRTYSGFSLCEHALDVRSGRDAHSAI